MLVSNTTAQFKSVFIRIQHPQEGGGGGKKKKKITPIPIFEVAYLISEEHCCTALFCSAASEYGCSAAV
jgi:hypothetical protein